MLKNASEIKSLGLGVLLGLFAYNTFMFVHYGEMPSVAKQNLKETILKSSKPVVNFKSIKTNTFDGKSTLDFQKDTSFYLVPASLLKLN